MKKRLFDIIASGTGIVVMSPLMGVIAGAVAASVGRPIIFKQKRTGKDGQPFDVYKFRTMTDARDDDGNLLPADQRTPPLLHYLRRSGLDELPQLYNVLRGDMSIVGPRPHSIKPEHAIPEDMREILTVLPGLTGPTQVRQIYEPKVQYSGSLKTDWDYATKPPSLKEDLKVIFWTVGTLRFGHNSLSHDQNLSNASPTPPR